MRWRNVVVRNLAKRGCRRRLTPEQHDRDREARYTRTLRRFRQLRLQRVQALELNLNRHSYIARATFGHEVEGGNYRTT
jgi:hypothetical protein